VNVLLSGSTKPPAVFSAKPRPGRFGAKETVLAASRAGDVDEVAYAILFLASDESSYITGSEIHVDGGVLAI
jgi:NAD(P)-dependent dehydrogenase (short-subunit alcohol dehydrogenase family)